MAVTGLDRIVFVSAFEPLRSKPVTAICVSNFSLFEGASPSLRNSADGGNRPSKGLGANKNDFFSIRSEDTIVS